MHQLIAYVVLGTFSILTLPAFADGWQSVGDTEDGSSEGVHGSTTTPETESHCVAGRSRAFSVLIRTVSSAIYSLV
jgi:hypothetical protein